MATQTLARVSTPTSARAFLKPSTPKPILKKPTPLPLSPSPFPFSASFSIYPSPSTQSPHVHFPPSPRLHSTHATHSPNTYDRAPISVSPNPLALPSWGDRVYSPTLGGFRLADPPQHVPFAAVRYESPTMPEFLDPRSPPPKIRDNYNNGNDGRSHIRFADLPNKPGRKPTELNKALTTYPRSPYPSAPLSPVDFEPAPEELSLREKAASRRTLSLDEKTSKRSSSRRVRLKPPAAPIPSPLSKSSYLSPVEERSPSPLTKPFSSSSSPSAKKPPPLPLRGSAVRNSADYRNNDNNNITLNVTPLDAPTSLTESNDNDSNSAELSQAFWQSVSLIGTDLQGYKVDSSRDMTSCRYPASAVGRSSKDFTQPASSSLSTHSHSLDADILVIAEAEAVPGSDSESQSQFMFATSDGVLWSPALPKKTHPETQSTSLSIPSSANGGVGAISELGSVLSPGKTISFGLNPLGTGRGMRSARGGGGMKISRSAVGSPSPNDPSATFPSFSAVLARPGNAQTVPELPALQYPPRAQVIEKCNAPKASRL